MHQQGNIGQGHGDKDQQEYAESRDAGGPGPIWIHEVDAIRFRLLIVDRLSWRRKITDVIPPLHSLDPLTWPKHARLDPAAVFFVLLEDKVVGHAGYVVADDSGQGLFFRFLLVVVGQG